MARFTSDEVAVIRKFLSWLTDEGWLESGRYSSGEGVTGMDDDGVTVTSFSAVSDYDGYTLGRDDSFIPWIALTDPETYKRQCDAEEAARRREESARQRAYAAQCEAQEREVLASLKAKYEKEQGTNA